MKRSCYICNQEASSKEHVPAKCFFPEDGKYKKNLITVHSCSLHNEDTSADDEYVRNIITMSLGNNNIAYNKFIRKTIKSFAKSERLFESTTRNAIPLEIHNGDVNERTIAIEIDRERFDKIMKKIAYGLFYYDNNCVWDRELIVTTEFLRYEDLSPDDLGKMIQRFRSYLIEPEFDGKNPMVFKYKFIIPAPSDEFDQVLWMKFYESFEVFITSIEGSTTAKI